jgi:hypothetical protein
MFLLDTTNSLLPYRLVDDYGSGFAEGVLRVEQHVQAAEKVVLRGDWSVIPCI